MVDVSLVLSQAWFILLFSLAVTALIFPIVFLAGFAYDMLLERYKKIPKVLLMLVVTFLGVLAAVTLLEIYLEFTLPLAFGNRLP
ncbi:hypothetical protein KJ765_01390 [Candidatus Micrarchaeota archaeon]|nr:hypothetical protein [Candidatus Micrarchaeota archaeon]